MKTASAFIFIMLMAAVAGAQTFYSTVLQQHNDSSLYIETSGGFSLLSNHVPLSFTQSFFSGNLITEDEKNATFDKLGVFNNTAIESSYGAMVLFRPAMLRDSLNHMRLYAGYQQNTVIFASFHRDVFSLAMFGNEFTIGNTATLSETSFNYWNFHKFYIGAVRSFGNEQQHRFGISPFISFHQPPVHLDITRGSFYTAPDTSSVSIMLNGQFSYGLPHNSVVQSIGGGIDLHYMNTGILEKHLLHLSLENLGIFQYIGNSYNFHSEKPVEITGFSFTSFDNLDSLFTEYVDSTMNSAITIEDSISLTSLLPMKISMVFVQTSAEKFGLHGSITTYPFHHRFPLIEAVPFYKLSDKTTIGIPLSYGVGLQAGVSVSAQWNNLRFAVHVKTSRHAGLSLHATGFFASGYLSYKL